MVCSTNESPENEDVTTESGIEKPENLTANSTKVNGTGDSAHNNGYSIIINVE